MSIFLAAARWASCEMRSKVAAVVGCVAGEAVPKRMVDIDADDVRVIFDDGVEGVGAGCK